MELKYFVNYSIDKNVGQCIAFATENESQSVVIGTCAVLAQVLLQVYIQYLFLCTVWKGVRSIYVHIYFYAGMHPVSISEHQLHHFSAIKTKNPDSSFENIVTGDTYNAAKH